MDGFWRILSGVQENVFLIGAYALLDYVLPMVSGPLISMFPQASQIIGGGVSAADFIAKQLMFHFFSATQIKGLLGM